MSTNFEPNFLVCPDYPILVLAYMEKILFLGELSQLSGCPDLPVSQLSGLSVFPNLSMKSFILQKYNQIRNPIRLLNNT